jgi:soluble lytic murein transglycosylase
MKKLITFITIVLILTSCAHKPMVPPPTEKFMEETRNLLAKGSSELDNYTHLNMEEKWARIYLHGQKLASEKRNQEACTKFKVLEETTFPLPVLVDIQILKNCPMSVIELRKRMDYPKNEIVPWAKEDFLMAALQRSREFGLRDHQAKFLGELAFYQDIREDQVKYMLKALDLAEDQGLKDKLFEKLTVLSPKYIKEPKPEQLFDVARDYERYREFEKATGMFRAIGQDTSSSIDEVVKAYERLAMSWKVQKRDNVKYRMILEELLVQLNLFQDKEDVKDKYLKYFFEYKTLIARRYWTENNRSKAHKILDEIFADERATQTQLAHAYWLKGEIHSELNHFKKSIENYKSAFEKEIDDNDLFLKVSWAYAWTLYLQKQYDDSAKAFENAITRIKDPIDQLRYKFWLARTYGKIKQKTKSREIYMDLLTHSPQHYYGIMARSEMGIEFPVAPELKNKLAEDYTIMWLKALTEKQMGKSYLEHKTPELKNTEEKINYLPYFSTVDWYEGALKLYFSIPSDERYKLADSYLPIVFPSPFRDLVKKASRKFKISSSFIYSIMRQESAFDPEVRSWADAFGLLQLTPERAEQLKNRAGVRYKTYTDLYEPQTNIYLGARLLKDLQIQFKNRFIEYVGSYNASEKAIMHWKKTRFNGDHLEFIERIPYDETRKYVKLVLRNYINYKRSLSNKSFMFPKNFFYTRLTD